MSNICINYALNSGTDIIMTKFNYLDRNLLTMGTIYLKLYFIVIKYLKQYTIVSIKIF